MQADGVPELHTTESVEAAEPPKDIPAKKRPRLDLNAEPRKRGKTIFGILVGTLNKAKIEDRQRGESEAVSRLLSLWFVR